MSRIKLPGCMYGSGYIAWGGAFGLVAMISIYGILNTI